MKTLLTAIQHRRDTAANWTSANPTLLDGEIGIETDTNKIKVGDGTTAWASKGYLSIAVGGTTPDIAAVTAATHNESATTGICVRLCNATSNNITFNLPTAVGNETLMNIKKTDSSANTVTIDPASTQTIDGGSTAVLTVQYECITLVSDGTNWSII